MREWRWLIYALVTGLLIACDMYPGKDQAIQEAQAMLDERIRDGGMVHPRHYSDELYITIPQDIWQKQQQLVQIEHGDLKRYTLEKWTFNNTPSTVDWSGTFVVLFYQTEYDKGNGREIITMFKPKDEEHFKILGHDFKSDHLTEQLDKAAERAARAKGASQ